MAGAGTDGPQIFLLPMVSHLVHFPIIVTCWLIWRSHISWKKILNSFHKTRQYTIKYQVYGNKTTKYKHIKCVSVNLLWVTIWSKYWKSKCLVTAMCVCLFVYTYGVHIWILLCRCPDRCSSSFDRFQHGDPTFRQCGSYYRCRDTTLKMSRELERAKKRLKGASRKGWGSRRMESSIRQRNEEY